MNREIITKYNISVKESKNYVSFFITLNFSTLR